MKKRGSKLSIHVLMGLLVGAVLVIGMFFIAEPLIKYFTQDMNNDDAHFLEASIEELSSLILSIEEGEKKEMPFYSYSNYDLYLNVYNIGSDITECYMAACIVLCFDEGCENLVSEDMVRLFDEDVVFNKVGKITSLDIEEGSSGRFLLAVEKKEGKISFDIVQQN